MSQAIRAHTKKKEKKRGEKENKYAQLTSEICDGSIVHIEVRFLCCRYDY